MKFRKFEYPSDEISRKSRTELMAECLKLGLPIRKDDTYRTLQLFLELLSEEESLFMEDIEEEKGNSKIPFKKFFIKILNGISEFLK